MQSIIYVPNVQLDISNALWKSGRGHLFTLFEAGSDNIKGGGRIKTENIKLECVFTYLFVSCIYSFRAQFTGSAGWTSEPFG